MPSKFSELPREKRQRIINAGLEVFAKNEYKHASTDDIAAKAGISKGLLFYYFRNKETLYLSLFRYCEEILKRQVKGKEFESITDFFELLEYGGRKKLEFLQKFPYLMSFSIRFYYSENKNVSQLMQKLIDGIFPIYFSHVDWSKFREGIDPQYLYRMLLWMADGYLHEKLRQGLSPDVDTILAEFNAWMTFFRKIAYKEEYQDAGNSH